MKNLTTFPRRITDITEEEFWSAMRVPRKRPAGELLREAISLGLEGRKKQAYCKLAAYHKIALVEEWDFIRQSATEAPKPSKRVLNDLLKHKITCWHDQTVQFGDKIDWLPSSLLASDCISGFHYFGWFRPAVTAYIRTGDKRYSDFLIDILEQYYLVREDPRWEKPDPGTKSLKGCVFNQLALAAKLSSWVGAYLGLIHNGELTSLAAESCMKFFLGSARAVKPQNPTFMAHNIQTHGCRALFQFARLFPEFRESGGWDRFATKRLCEQVTKGFFADGCHRERVWGYGSHTLRSLSEAYELAQRYGGLGEHDQAFLQGLRRGYRFYAKSLGPRPKLLKPTYGDAGAGTSGESILEAGRPFFPRGTDENLGVDRTKSYFFKPSGFAVMRNGDDEESSFLTVDFGKFAGWHSHQDLLSMNFWSHGEMLLEELCRFGPYSNPLDCLFRAPEAHNLVTIDGMVYDCRNVRGEDVAWHSTDEVDYFSATHWAYHYFVFGRDGGPVSPNIEARVRRTTVFVKDPGYAVVLDSVTDLTHPDRFNRAITQWWHSPFPFEEVKPGLARTKGRVGCAVAYARTDGLVRLETGADFTEAEGRKYGASFDRHHLRARRWMGLEHPGIVGFATLLYPYRGKMPEVSIRLWRRTHRACGGPNLTRSAPRTDEISSCSIRRDAKV